MPMNSFSSASMASLTRSLKASTDASMSVSEGNSEAFTARAEKILQHEHGTLKAPPFVGREREMAGLMHALDQLACGNAPRVLSISGAPGSGKSTLAMQLKARIVENNGYFIRGKFDEGKTAVPYNGLAMALEDFALQILEKDLEMTIQRRLRKFMQGNESVLLDVFPALTALIGPTESTTKETEEQRKLDPESETAEADSDDEPHQNVEQPPQHHESVDNNNNQQQIHKDSGAQRSKRRVFFFQQFFHAVLSHKNPRMSETAYSTTTAVDPNKPPCIVLLLDDVQWADGPSLDLISSLVRDPDMGSFLLVITNRPITDANHVMQQQLDSWKLERVSIQNFPLDNLDLNSIETLVDYCLQNCNDDPDDPCPLQSPCTAPLAQIVHQRTQGNPFFAVEFLKALVEQRLLQYSYANMQWKWDNNKVHSVGLTMSDSPVDLVIGKAKRLSNDQQLILLICSCLGGTFKAKLIRKVLKSLAGSDDRPALLEKMTTKDIPVLETVERFVYLGFLDRNGAYFFFVHDLVRQAAMEFVSKDEIDWMRLRVGQCILQGVRPQQETSEDMSRKGQANLFLGVDLCNSSAHLIPECAETADSFHRVDLARFNYRAGEKAFNESAFVQAVHYLKTGIELLGKSNTDGELTNSLLALAAESSYCAGKFAEMNTFVETLLSKSDCTEDTRLRMLLFRVRSASSQAYAQEALNLGFDALKLLGMCTLPRHPKLYHVVIGLMKTQKVMKKHTFESLRDLPMVTDKKREMAMEFLHAMNSAASVADQNLLFLMLLKSLRWSVKYGISKHSPSQFAMYGLMAINLLEDTNAGVLYGEVAMAQAELADEKGITAETSTHTFGLLRPWTSDMRSCYAPLLYAQNLAAECGDIEMVTYCLFFGNTTLWLTAMASLPALGANLQRSCAMCRDFQHFTQLEMLTNMGMHIRHLCIGKERESFAWLDDLCGSQIGTFISEPNQQGTPSCIDPNIEIFYASVAMERHLLLDERSEALKCADITREIGTKYYSGMNYVARTQFYRGVVYLSVPKNGKKVPGKHLRKAKRVLPILKKWSRLGHQNCAHMVTLIEAEMARVKGQYNKAAELYAAAINASESGEYTQDTGTFHECAAKFFLYSKNDSESAAHHIEQAILCYRQWGASAVVERIQRSYPGLLSTKAGCTSRSSLCTS